jgi:hypothetical protein
MDELFLCDDNGKKELMVGLMDAWGNGGVVCSCRAINYFVWEGRGRRQGAHFSLISFGILIRHYSIVGERKGHRRMRFGVESVVCWIFSFLVVVCC